MIHEYAIEPEAFVEWAKNRLACRYIKNSFSEGQPRIISRFPKKWIRQCLESQDLDDNSRKNLEELIFYLKEITIRRSDPSYNPKSSWLENAENENRRHPFKAVLTTSSPNNMNNILLSTEISEWDDHPIWRGDTNISVERTVSSMVAAVAPLLQKANEIHFVDPYFSPLKSRFVQPLAAMLQAAVSCSAYNLKKNIVYHVSSDNMDWDDLNEFPKDCQNELPTIVPLGLMVQFKIWKERVRGERMHNRFILTDIGGISFGTGLDTGRKSGQTDDVALLGREVRTKRWQQYVSNNGDFILENEFTVTGEMS